jgi:polyisoprenoid-binding protein YceI
MTKRLSLFILAAGFIVFNSCTSAPDADKAETTDAKEVAAADGEALKVDPAASKVEWIGTKVSGYHEGTVNVKSGELKVKDGNVTGGNFVLDLTSLTVTGPKDSDTAMNNKLLGHLKSPDFFDVAANPDASFVITEVKPFSGTVKDTTDPRQEAISKYKVANPTHSISGNLTIKGVTKNIEFPASVTVTDGTVDAIAKFNIDRSQWNIIYPGKPDDLIRNEVHLGIALKAAK